MKKRLLGILLMASLSIGSVMITSAANIDPDVCEHPQVVNISYGYPYQDTLVHQVSVGTKPNGDPIITDCIITRTLQNYKRICTYCQKTFSTWEQVTSATHSISH